MVSIPQADRGCPKCKECILSSKIPLIIEELEIFSISPEDAVELFRFNIQTF